MIKLRLATEDDIDSIYEIIEEVKIYLKNEEINQWQNGYPDRNTIKNDVDNKKGHLILVDEKIAGYICIDFDGEPGYEEIVGNWLTNQKYVVIHRMAIKKEFRGNGISYDVFKLVENIAEERGISSIKIDTDVSNKRMQHLLNKLNYTYCGTIISTDGGERLAYEKII